MNEFNWKRGLIGGGLLLVLILTSFYPIINEEKVEPEASYNDIHNCFPIPDDVPRVFKNGKPIGWGCEMASFYYNDDLKFHYDEEGGLVAIEKVR